MSDFEYSENTKELINSNLFNWKEDLEATITGYQSPITIIAKEIETQIENDCVKAVKRYGFDVNAKELYKALKYDREQYQKGYEDAKRDYARPAGEWIVGEYMDNHSDILPKYTCPFCRRVSYINYDYCHCGADLRGGKT